jgi:hypothetical protein
MDFPYLQAIEGLCRDEFTPIPEAINSDEFKYNLMKQNGIQT